MKANCNYSVANRYGNIVCDRTIAVDHLPRIV